ncbi:LysR family transcriptional regulator [Phytoactinopolyspora limicola]|uniref:LysR family transcriptional regulator n=1 Tax=Phytoactinopolyspora limicola TaxID=2715536 RepID=UPI0014077DBB|nr:LysR family transcriptional regulator [Phytoactinopolyspora limicola]
MNFANAFPYRLDWIVSFVAVARAGGFSAAAKAQHRSQPRISSHIGALERVLGATLFDRSVHPATLTPEGRALLPHAEDILARLAILGEVTGATGGTKRGVVRVGMYPSAAAFLYPPLVRRLRHAAPGVTAVLREGDTLALDTLLADGDIDLAVRPVLPPVRADQLAYRRLWSEPLVAVVPDGHPLSDDEATTLARLVGFPLVTIGEPDSGERQFETNLAFLQAGLQPNIAFQTNQPQTLAALVRSGLGVGFTNRLAMTTTDHHGLVLVPVTAAHAERQVAVWWHAARPESPATTLVRDVIAVLPPPSLTP